MTVYAEHIEPVTHPRAKRADLVRVFLGEALVAATCRDCTRLTPARQLVTDSRGTGGRALLCRACKSVANRARVRRPRLRG